MRVHFASDAWKSYLDWLQTDPVTFAKINTLIEDVRRSPFAGLGKPEPLRGEFAGWWSRRISGEHRLVYRVEGRAGADQRIDVLACQYHYKDR